VSVIVASSLAEAFAALDATPDAQVLAGGTDFMVEVNYAHRRPAAVVAVNRVPELRGWERRNGEVVLRAGLTYTEMMAPELARLIPALAQAARTVGSPPIRNAGTLGGNLGTASPAGDTLPVLAALDARIVVGDTRGGRREVALDELVVGPKQTTLAPGELVLEARVPVAGGPQEFLKVGTRNAMVISVAALALVVDFDARALRCALGAVGPTVLRAGEAEAFAADEIDWAARRLPSRETAAEFGRRAAAAARPIDDHRSIADYRRHAIGVLAARALTRVLS
jgi:CO/xanthine dehydrogenase FAD-binding subunit